MQFSYHIVDVFTRQALEGNALAVLPDATGLDSDAMQRIAREFNLSESAFVLPRESSHDAIRVRIFTPTYEMEFAGHPTIGTAWVMRELGAVSRDSASFVLRENVGDVRVRVDGGPDPLIWLTTPPIATLQTFDRAACAAAVSLSENDLLPSVPCELRTAGNPNIYIAVRDGATVDRAEIDSAAFYRLISARSEPTCVFVFAPVEGGAYSRMFAPEFGVVEDPATGSATGPLAQFMMDNALAPKADGTRFISEQGTKMRRRSLLHVLIHGEGGVDGIEIGGYVTPVAQGTLTI